MEVALDIIVRSTEIDVNGHVNNAKYLEYLEWGREEWYDQVGFTYNHFLELGIQTVTVNVNINYRKECKQGDQLRITTRPHKVGRTSFVVTQKIINQQAEIVVDAMVTSVTMDVDTRQSRELPDTFRKVFD